MFHCPHNAVIDKNDKDFISIAHFLCSICSIALNKYKNKNVKHIHYEQ